MANRHKDFNELVASQFEDLEFSQIYIMNLINKEGLPLDEALKETVKSMGLQNFANKAEISIQYVSDFVNSRKKLSTDTIDKYLQKVFNLKIKISVEAA
ncbi:MAG: hypothetical protein K9K67_00615 [Bacteriovoracaceae bacterium]|nr:hypothetical protein [Bacteriovoracaceae bacterium]